MAGLDEVADELYGGAPSDFIARRDAAAKQARADGDRELAAEIAALRKPTVSAWLVNLLFQDDESLAEQIVALGDQLRDAERTLDGAELRNLTRARRELVRGLVTRARQLARAEGHRATEATAQEVDATLTAALADPAVAEEVTSGRLTTPREYAGFGSVGIRPDLRVVDGDRSRPVVGRPRVRPTGKGAGGSGASGSGASGSGASGSGAAGSRAGGRRAATSEDDPAHAVQAHDGKAHDAKARDKEAEARAAEERRREEERREQERREQERRERRRRENEERLRLAEDAWHAAREKAREAAAARDAAGDERRSAAEAVRELRSKLAAAEREEAAADRALERAEAKEQSARKAVEAATEDVREAEAALRADPS